MPKFLVSMNYVEARSTKFIVEAEHEDDIWDVIGNMDMDFLEENLEWHTSLYESPEIDEIKIIPKNSKDYTINKKIQKEFNKIIKELSEEN